jgi:hypothetical protein
MLLLLLPPPPRIGCGLAVAGIGGGHVCQRARRPGLLLP